MITNFRLHIEINTFKMPFKKMFFHSSFLKESQQGLLWKPALFFHCPFPVNQYIALLLGHRSSSASGFIWWKNWQGASRSSQGLSWLALCPVSASPEQMLLWFVPAGPCLWGGEYWAVERVAYELVILCTCREIAAPSVLQEWG